MRTIDAGILASGQGLVLTVKTDNAGVSASNQFTIQTFGTGYNYDVEYEGNVSTGLTGNTTLTFSIAGTYKIKISGAFPQYYCNNEGDEPKILAVKFGNIKWQSFIGAFYGCNNLLTIEGIPDLRNVADMDNAFRTNTVMTSVNVSNWNVSTVVDMRFMFYNCTSLTYLDVGDWNVSNVQKLRHTFRGCSGLVTLDVSNWDTSNVDDMTQTFDGCTSLVGLDISSWNVSSVTQMTGFLAGIAISTSVYDAALVYWDSLTLVASVVCGMGNSTYTGTSVDSGTTDGTTANKLIQSGQNFLTTVSIGDIVYNTTDSTYAEVTAVDSDTQLSLDVDIMISGEAYTILSSAAAKARYSIISNDLWTITDGGPV